MGSPYLGFPTVDAWSATASSLDYATAASATATARRVWGSLTAVASRTAVPVTASAAWNGPRTSWTAMWSVYVPGTPWLHPLGPALDVQPL